MIKIIYNPYARKQYPSITRVKSVLDSVGLEYIRQRGVTVSDARLMSLINDVEEDYYLDMAVMAQLPLHFVLDTTKKRMVLGIDPDNYLALIPRKVKEVKRKMLMERYFQIGGKL